MMAGELDVEMQLTTNEGHSFNQNQSSDHVNDVLHQRESRKMRRIELLISNFILEGLSIAFDQLSTPKKPIYAFMSMITASLGLLLSMIELSYRARENDMIISRLLGEALENFGFFYLNLAMRLRSSTICYLYKKKIDSPIKISILPLIFLICVAISKLYHNYCRQHPYITRESSVDASKTTTLSRVESSVSLGNASAIEEIELVGEDDPGVVITTKESRNDTTVHHRIRKGRWTPEEDERLLAYVTSSKYGVKKYEKERRAAFRTKSI